MTRRARTTDLRVRALPPACGSRCDRALRPNSPDARRLPCAGRELMGVTGAWDCRSLQPMPAHARIKTPGYPDCLCPLSPATTARPRPQPTYRTRSGDNSLGTSFEPYAIDLYSSSRFSKVTKGICGRGLPVYPSLHTGRNQEAFDGQDLRRYALSMLRGENRFSYQVNWEEIGEAILDSLHQAIFYPQGATRFRNERLALGTGLCHHQVIKQSCQSTGRHSTPQMTMIAL